MSLIRWQWAMVSKIWSAVLVHTNGTVQHLHTRLLVHAQHQRRLGWVQIQPDDVADLVDELGSADSLDTSVQVRLEPNARQIRLIEVWLMPS